VNIEFTDEFEVWFVALSRKKQKRVAKIIDMLEMMDQGLLGTRYAKSIVGTDGLFELVIQISGQPYRILYATVSDHGVVLLIGGNKKGDDRFYQREIPRAEALLLRWLEEGE
jgi:hypothetical protein